MSLFICYHFPTCPGGVTGSHKGLKIPRRKACGFDSRPGHDAKRRDSRAKHDTTSISIQKFSLAKENFLFNYSLSLL